MFTGSMGLQQNELARWCQRAGPTFGSENLSDGQPFVHAWDNSEMSDVLAVFGQLLP